MNQILPQQLTVIALTALFGTGFSTNPLTYAAPPKKPQVLLNSAWLPDKAMSATLGHEVAVAGYTMRLPIGYTADLKNEQKQGLFKISIFSLHKPNSVGPSMFVMAVSVPPKVAAADASDAPSTAEQLFDGDGSVHGKADLIKTLPQKGLINGLPAARPYFKYKGTDGKERHGFHYGVADGANRLLITVVDQEPYSKTTLPLAEAAVLTLKR